MIGIRCQPHMNNCSACRNPRCQHECHSRQDLNERQEQLRESKSKGRNHGRRKNAYWMENPDEGEEYWIMRKETA